MTEETSQNELLAIRRAKLDDLRSKGNAFPNNFKRNALAEELHSSYDSLEADELEKEKVYVSVAGRVMLQRIMGKASFITIQDLTGRIQAYIKSDNLDEEAYNDFKKWDLGDVVGVKGKLFKTKTNELTVEAESIFLLTKSLRPLPEKHAGLVDTEQRYRKRYLDLLTNEDSLKVFKTRSKLISEIRKIFNEEGYLEVETPMMHPIQGGATARPFVTHHNALNMDLYLRVAPELYLKRLVIGGLERVFEINRNFRNEGLSTKHNPEFTMLEYYTAYADYKDQMDFMQTLLNTLAKRVLGKSVIETEGNKYDLSKPFERMTLIESIVKYLGVDKGKLEDRKELEKIAKKLNVEDMFDFVGRVDQEDLPLYYNAADVCVVPSYYESFGLAALESMACGTPVVAARVGGLSTIVQHGRTGFLKSWRCPEAFANSLEMIISSDRLKQSMGLAARRRAEGMGWDQVASDIRSLYESLTMEPAKEDNN